MIAYRAVTNPLKNSCRANCVIAKSHAKCGAISHIAPRYLVLPQNRKKRANTKFITKNILQIPVIHLFVRCCFFFIVFLPCSIKRFGFSPPHPMCNQVIYIKQKQKKNTQKKKNKIISISAFAYLVILFILSRKLCLTAKSFSFSTKKKKNI